MSEFPKWDYQEYPKTLARDDFWGQGRRTIMGRRISEEEVVVLVDRIRELLDLRADDTLLDLGCGNGALTARLFDACAGYVGVDLSEYLIGVAQEYFERRPQFVFLMGDVTDFARSVERPERFTKALSYAVVQYLRPAVVGELLRTLHQRFPKLERLVLGNVPDRARAAGFFQGGFSEEQLDQHESQIGRWWSAEELAAYGAAAGWEVDVTRMDESFFNARYRFDAVLTRS